MPLIFATGNTHKLAEVSEILKEYRISILSMRDIGLYEEIKETGTTLEENAMLKARYVYNLTGNDVFAEDTGLEVEALENQPGVMSARFAGPERDSAKNMELLLKRMENVQNRKARFRAVIALILNQSEYLFEGVLNGRIANGPSGTKGFGYDPLFVPDGFQVTLGEIEETQKNRISHRYHALKKMENFLNKIL